MIIRGKWRLTRDLLHKAQKNMTQREYALYTLRLYALAPACLIYWTIYSLAEGTEWLADRNSDQAEWIADRIANVGEWVYGLIWGRK